MPLKWLSNRLKSGEEAYPSIQVDEDLHGEINDALNGLTDGNEGPLLLVRPPRENEGMDATISMYQTLHNPREKEVGFGPFSGIQNKAHAHAHEIWYHDAQMQFFLRPETKVDANKMRRQVRSNYPNVDISEANTRFPSIEVGEYVSVAEIGLKRDFYFPIKSKLHNDEDFEIDPYSDLTSDMVVEEDETSDGRQVEAKGCKLVVQTMFESARDVWSKSRPYGIDVTEVAQGMQEGEVHGNLLKGFEVKKPGTLTNRAAKILETLRGSKAYYITMRVIAISPYEEIAERRCRNVAYDFETYYNTVTQQGLTPIELTEDQMRESLLEAVRREHNIGFRDRFMSTGKFLQPVETLGSLAHIPNDDINTPVIDWAKQDTGPGTPSGGDQLEDQKRESEQNEDSGIGQGANLHSSQPPDKEKTGEGVDPEGGVERNETDEGLVAGGTGNNSTTNTGSGVRDRWNKSGESGPTESTTDSRLESDSSWSEPDEGSSNRGMSDLSGSGESNEPNTEPTPPSEEPESERESDLDSNWGVSKDAGRRDSEIETKSESESDSDSDSDSDGFTPAFARGNNFGDGWDDEEEFDNSSPGRR